MRTMICGLVLALTTGAAAYAGQTPSAASAALDASTTGAQPAPRTLYICHNDALTRRGFAREFGSVEFVTAQAAKARGATWSSPKCISASEARRLRSQFASR